MIYGISSKLEQKCEGIEDCKQSDIEDKSRMNSTQENLSLMLGDHCKYPSYDYAQLDKNMPDLPTLCSEFPPESAHFFYIRHHSPSKNIQKKSHQKICLSVSDAMDSVSSQTVDPNRHHSPRFTGPVPLQPLNLHII